MASIAETIRRLRTMPDVPLSPGGSGRLEPFTAFGSNPGALNGWAYVPDGATALVVVLHGCTQSAAAYDLGSGWTDLAARHGFAVLFPEQGRGNNANGCFNWFEPGDTRRDGGEAASIRQMIEAMLDRHPIDPARVFITGLSAGGAMTSVMLATYPELFAGGGIIAGLPFGAASGVAQAFERMRGQGHPGDEAYRDRILAASVHRGPWPRIAVWHGDADATVSPKNADAIIGQWRALHGVGTAPDRVEVVAGHRRRVWLNRDGHEAIVAHEIVGMGHGTPLKTSGDESCGRAGPYMLEAGISSTWHLAESWDLLDHTLVPSRETAPPAAGRVPPEMAHAGSVQATIEGALRAAGLLR